MAQLVGRYPHPVPCPRRLLAVAYPLQGLVTILSLLASRWGKA